MVFGETTVRISYFDVSNHETKEFHHDGGEWIAEMWQSTHVNRDKNYTFCRHKISDVRSQDIRLT